MPEGRRTASVRERRRRSHEGGIDMYAYGWTFLIIAIALAIVAFGGYTTAYALTAKVAAGICLLVSLVAFVAEKREVA